MGNYFLTKVHGLNHYHITSKDRKPVKTTYTKAYAHYEFNQLSRLVSITQCNFGMMVPCKAIMSALDRNSKALSRPLDLPACIT